MRQSGPAWRSLSSNQSTMIFSRETNPPSATYADSVVSPLSTSAQSTLVASASVVSHEDYCDSKAPLIIKGSSHSSSTSAVFLQYPPIGPASSHQVGPFQCQHLECSSTEQMSLTPVSIVQHDCHYQYFILIYSHLSRNRTQCHQI